MGKSRKKAEVTAVATPAAPVEKKVEPPKVYPKLSSPIVGVVTATPWGEFVVVDEGKLWKTTKIKVNPGCEANGAPHTNMEELWTIVEGNGQVAGGVSGTRKVMTGDMVIVMKGMPRKILSTGKEPLVMFAVQTPLMTLDGEVAESV